MKIPSYDLLLGLGALSCAGLNILALAALPASAARIAPPEPPVKRCIKPRVVDGDTIKCGKLTVRLSGIDAPELAGHCRRGRVCAPGDPVASTANLAKAVKLGRVTYQSFGVDLFGRTLGIVRARGVNLSCDQMRSGNAIFAPRWDKQGRIDRECF